VRGAICWLAAGTLGLGLSSCAELGEPPSYSGPPLQIWYGSSTLEEKYFTIKNPSDMALHIVGEPTAAQEPTVLLSIEAGGETTIFIDFVDGGILLKGPEKRKLQFVALPDAEMEIEFKYAYQTPPVVIFRLLAGETCHFELSVEVAHSQ
jgi:hypothetical protein